VRLRYTISILSTVAVLVASVLYLSFGVLKMRAGDQTTVTITAPKSNGLHAGSAVLLRGVPIGSVQEVSYGGGDITMRITYDAKHKIPLGSTIVIENQSMLGESGVFLNPDEPATGPVIGNGADLKATVVEVPASVPELLASTQTLLDQVDPTLVNELVDTLSTALAGTDRAVDRLEPAARVLAATMIYSQPSLVKIIGNATTMIGDGDWIGPSLRPTKAELILAGQNLSEVIEHVKPFADFTDGGKIIGDRWKPVLTRSADAVSDLAPKVGTLADALLPAARRTGSSIFETLDMATLLRQAALMMPGDSVRLDVRMPR